MTEAQEMVRRVVERAGSINLAAPMIGASYRHVARWLSGRCAPKRSNLLKILIALEGDNIKDRERRLSVYTARATAGVSVFGG